MINLVIGLGCLFAAYWEYRKEKRLLFLTYWNITFGVLNTGIGVYSLFFE